MRVGLLVGLIVLVAISGCESRAQARRKQLVEDAQQLSLAYQSYSARPVGVARKRAHSSVVMDSDRPEPEASVPARDSTE